MFWIISSLFLVVAGLFVLYPYWRHYSPGPGGEKLRKVTNLAIYEERQRELRAELETGSLDPDQYQALELELKKSLLSDTLGLDPEIAAGTAAVATGKQPERRNEKQRKGNQARTIQPTANSLASKAIPLVVVALIPVVALIMYARWGFLEDIQLVDLYERTIAADNDQQAIADLVYALGEVTRERPDNPWPNYFLARNLSNLGLFGEAEPFFQRAADLLPEGPDKAATLGLLAQIKYLANGGEMTEEVMAVVRQARAINPSEISALQLLALDAETRQDLNAAIGYWRLMIQASPNSALARQLRQRISTAQLQLAQDEGASASSGPRIEVTVSLSGQVDVPADWRVFVAARNAAQEGMPPLAALDLTVADLPTTVTLDNNAAVTPAFNLSSADTIYITATVSRSGSANVQSGDYRAVSDPFAHNGQHAVVELEIRDIVP